MLQYLIILLDDTSVSYCHYDVSSATPRLIPLDSLRQAILFAMKHNLMVQFVYPDYDLPEEYLRMIDSIDHHDIVPAPRQGDVVVASYPKLIDSAPNVLALKIEKDTLFSCGDNIASFLRATQRLNVVITDIADFNDEDFVHYAHLLDEWISVMKEEYMKGRNPQCNLLTDRILLQQPNHCNAGVTTLTVAPNGCFYLCPAFYYDNPDDTVGSLASEVAIPNRQLLTLEYAPLCRRCDAYQCHRCPWLNQRTTHDINIPSRQQCIVAHIEREAARRLLYSLRQVGSFAPEIEIDELNYYDTFEVRNDW